MPDFDRWLSTAAYPPYIDRTAEAARRITKARNIAESTMTDSGAIRRNTPASDGMGGQTDNWATVATVKCRLMTRLSQPRDRTGGERLETETEYTLRFPVGTDVRNTDRVVVTAAGSATVRTFEVVRPVEYTINPSLSVAVVEVS